MGLTRYDLELKNADSTEPLSEAESDAIVLLPHYACLSKYENDWPSTIHTHPFSELIYITGGKGFFVSENAEHPISEGSFIVTNANTPHTEKSTEEAPLEYISVAVKNIYFSFDNYKDFIILHYSATHQDPRFYMEGILQELMHKPPDYVNVCQHLLEILVIQLSRRINNSFQLESTTRITRECIKIKKYIEAHYTQNITLECLSALTHMNKYYMSHMFTRHFDCSPIQYLCQVRIKNSKALLVNTDFSITEIASRTGFSSHSYFSQCFQKSCGTTPSAYRKRKNSEKAEQG